MTRTLVPLTAGLLIGCSPGGSFEGKLVDAMSGQARTDIRVLAKSTQTADLTCQVREATSDANGVFRIENTCPDTTYTLKLTDDTLLVQDSPELIGGQQSTGTVDLKIWRAPAGSGVFKLNDDKLTAIRTFADVASETILGTEEKVLYPTKLPRVAPDIESSAWLVLAGKDTLDHMQFHPLIADDAVRNFEGEVSIENHVYVGVSFTSDTEFTRTAATVDTSKIKNVTAGDRLIRFIPSDALAPGRYAMMPADARRMYVIDFGGTPAKSAQADTE